jgi:hypothetical protein
MRSRVAEARADLKTGDRVRANTSEAINERLDREMRERVREYADRSPGAISRRIEELEGEWDMERYLEANASALAFTGVMLGAVHDRRWLIVPGVVLSFLFQHAVQGWCPPVPVFRRLGVRTRQEIEREKYALKALRGDFEGIAEERGGPARAGRALDAASR